MTDSPAQNAPAGSFIVIENLNDPSDRKIVAAGSMFAMIYTQVFGPASQADCEAWVARQG